ncbi:MAG: ethanolamine ammonia-lyase reactivating factor EutA [Candidatus Hermodarchaeota archaeon]
MHSLPAQRTLNSVGIDVGTTTSHLIFSELVLKKDLTSRTEKYHVAERKIKYRGQIFFTPIVDNEIDIERLTDQLLNEYRNAGISISEIDTGAVIITGESAKRENAERIVEKLARETGKFVAASAGPNFESIISAYGSGAVDYSKKHACRLIHTDVGGGTSNIAVIDEGKIMGTACINVGGRLLAFNDNDEIIRLEPAGKLLLEHCKLDQILGGVVKSDQKDILAQTLASALLEVLNGSELSPFVKELMMTEPLSSEMFDGEFKWSFSGGVAEYIYSKNFKDFNDLGLRLGNFIRNMVEESQNGWIEVPEKIRATVIGASEYTLQVSGSTTFISPKFGNKGLPIRNLKIVKPYIQRNLLSEEYVAQQIASALKRLDILEGDEPLALAFDDPVRTVYDKLKTFSLGLSKALPQTVKKSRPIILIFDTDIGNSVGNVLFRETGIINDILSIDEISLREGDFIDIGKPIVENRVFPVVVKSLIFG